MMLSAVWGHLLSAQFVCEHRRLRHGAQLAHLRVPSPGPAFCRCVKRAMPDHEERRAWLATHGGGVVAW